MRVLFWSNIYRNNALVKDLSYYNSIVLVQDLYILFGQRFIQY
jgi:hypothetical protein